MDGVRWADARDLVVRVIVPGIALWGLVVALGLAFTGPLAAILNTEDPLNRAVVATRGSAWDAVTFFLSYLGSTEMIAVVGVAVSGLVLWRTHEWRRALVPVIAILLQLSVYLGVIALIRRERPSVARLDELLPMSSFPSGHMGASVALYLSCILLSSGIAGVGRRRVAITVCILVPLLVGTGRLLRGMHHPSDLLVGALVGATCALLAYSWYRRRSAAAAAPAVRPAAAV
jgi:membrane-associated phospholipid phosphatase